MDMDRSISLLGALQHAAAAFVRPLSAHLTYTVRSGIAAGLKRRGGLGFLPRKATKEELFYQSLTDDLAGKTVYDIGSYEGIFTLFAARAVGPGGRVIVCEPNPESYRRTTCNLAVNRFCDRVRVFNVALGAAAAEGLMTFPRREPARATLDASISRSIISDERGRVATVRVPIERLDDLVASYQLPPPTFVKIDTEGAEFDILRGARRTLESHSPALFLETHGATPDQATENEHKIYDFLHSIGYVLFNLTGKAIAAGDRMGHVYGLNPLNIGMPSLGRRSSIASLNRQKKLPQPPQRRA
jgi:FkbM family methyltransferase